jgi:hypothetical protein
MQLRIIPPELAALDDVTYAAALAVADETDPAQRWWLAYAAAIKQDATPAEAARIADRFGTRSEPSSSPRPRSARRS